MATYNGERFLREQLDSIYRQTLQPDEVLVVDDCSTDGTVGILEEYHKKYGLKYVVNEHNLHVNKNFEKGLKLCTGDYISICDQDDVWFENKNEILYKKLMELEIQYPNTECAVSSRNTFVDENMKEYHNTELCNDTEDYRDTVLFHLSQGASMMFNRKCLDIVLPLPKKEYNICYDSYIGYIIAMVGHKYDLHQSLMFYRVHGANVTAQLHIKKNDRQLFRHRYTGVVPAHMIRTFKLANIIIKNSVSKEKINYVDRIIRLSCDISLFSRLYFLFTTPQIPLSIKVDSLKAHIANWFFNKRL